MMDKLRWPQFNPKTIRRVRNILQSGRVNYWTGEECRLFEREFSDWLGIRHALTVSNGTAALHLALEALGIGEGDEVICTPYSFRASATCANNAGAKPVFADVGDDHLLNAETIAKAITPKTKAVVVVHLYGQVADMGPILKLAKAKHLYVIEDCAQCLGGEYSGKKVGTLGDVGCFSFCQSKHITTAGEGGMICTKNAKIAKKVQSLRDHGWVVGSEPKVFDIVGYNFRMTEIQAAVGRGELERFDSWNLPQRKLLANRLIAGLKGLSTDLIKQWPVDTEKRKASFWLIPFVLDEKKLKYPVSKFIEMLQAEGAGAYKIMWPLMAPMPKAKALIPNTVGFWVHPTYTIKDIDKAVKAFLKVTHLTIRRQK